MRLKFRRKLFRIQSNYRHRWEFVIVREKLSASGRRQNRGIGLVGLGLALAPLPVSAIALQVDPAMSTDGTAQLSWAADGRVVTLQRANDVGFADARVIYRGGDSASLRTGLRDGVYHYRVRARDADGRTEPWSAPVTVTVRHHDALRTWGLFGLGAGVFAATLGLILSGARREAGHG